MPNPPSEPQITMAPQITVIICTHNPRQDYLQRTLEALRQQTLSCDRWDLILVDNASHEPIETWVNLAWHPTGRLVNEPALGLTRARLCGFRAARSPLLVYVDDDNLLAPTYLAEVEALFAAYPQLGAVGGKSHPEFEAEPEPWMREFDTILALRDFGDRLQIAAGSTQQACPTYPAFAPAGAGLALRQVAFDPYWQHVQGNADRLALGRSGQKLTSGEDNDIILTLLNQGWDVGYAPQLCLTHLIAANRTNRDYLARLNYAASCSWVQVLHWHGIHLWPAIPRWSVTLRQLRAWWRYHPWKTPAAYVRWRGVCGLFEGQAAIALRAVGG